jgi:hypothetical protein
MCHSLQPACERRKLDRDSCAPARVHLNWLRVHPKRCDLVRTSRAFVAQAAGSFVRRRIVAPAGLPPPDFPRLRSKPSWPSPARAAAHPNFLRARRFRRASRASGAPPPIIPNALPRRPLLSSSKGCRPSPRHRPSSVSNRRYAPGRVISPVRRRVTGFAPAPQATARRHRKREVLRKTPVDLYEARRRLTRGRSGHAPTVSSSSSLNSLLGRPPCAPPSLSSSP